MEFYVIKDSNNKPIDVYLTATAALTVLRSYAEQYKENKSCISYHYELMESDEKLRDEIERLNDELSKERRDNYEKDEEIDALNFRLNQIQQGAYNEGYIVAIKDIKEIIIKCSNGWGV